MPKTASVSQTSTSSKNVRKLSKEEPLLPTVKQDSSDEEMMVIESPTKAPAQKPRSPEPLSPTSYMSMDIEDMRTMDTTDSMMRSAGIMKHPTSIVSGTLIQYKIMAEEGPTWLRFVGFLAAIGMIVTSIIPYTLDYAFANVAFTHIVISIFTVIGGICIVILDGRSFFSSGPVNCRARMRNRIVRQASLLKQLYGRGMLYMLTGVLHMAQTWLVALVSGGIMIVIGLIAITIGMRSSHYLYKLRASLTNDEFLWLEFSRHDTNDDGHIDASGLANLLWSLGLEFDDMHVLKAFNAINKERTGKVNFGQFRMYVVCGVWLCLCILELSNPPYYLIFFRWWDETAAESPNLATFTLVD